MRLSVSSSRSRDASSAPDRLFWARLRGGRSSLSQTFGKGAVIEATGGRCYPPGMDDAAALAEIRREAQAALDAWPEAVAAVLFGSRARGNHRPDSDWDVAFIVKGDGDCPEAVPAGVPFSCTGVRRRHYVNGIVIPERLVARKSRCIGHAGRGVAMDGRLLAGTWERPKPEGAPFMETERYVAFMRNSIRMIRNAVEAAARPGEPDGWEDAPGEAHDFIAATTDAAEHLAKAVMGRHGLDPRRTHVLDELAEQARKAGFAALAKDLGRMNGETGIDHQTRYGTDAPAGFGHAMTRLPVVLDVLRKEIGDLPAGYIGQDESNGLKDSATGILSACAETLRNAIQRDGKDVRLPEGHEWLKPMFEARETLAATLDDVAGTLRRDGMGSGNDE